MNERTLLHFLFPYYPREISKYRRVVYSFSKFYRYVEAVNGIDDVYVSLYDVNFSIIDKVWFEIDTPSIEKSIEVAKQVRNRLDDYEIPNLVMFSGSKGFHFYIPVKRFSVKNKDFGDAILHKIVKSLVGDIKYIDRYSQSRQLVRVPNTINMKTGKYCTPVSINDWNFDIINHKNKVDYYVKPIDIEYLIDINDIFYGFSTSEAQELYRPEIEAERSLIIPDGDIFTFLSFFVRPCLVEYLRETPNPSHNVRTDLVAELYWSGFNKDEIFEILKRMKWRDFNEEITEYHISKIIEKKLKPFKKYRLSEETGLRC